MTRVRSPFPAAAFAPSAASAPAPEALASAGTEAGIDLRQRDVLLITIDALRADRLRAYGGHGLTPALDALAEESVVFLRANTPTPHTSYALSSLMTGKFMQPLMALGDGGADHPTLPVLLRRNGYRTAAFYPPSIFFVDGERFEWLERGQLGFEYAKAMFASAEERVPQLERYLREVDPGHPLFVWVHLFEPHEPYEPPPKFARGDSPLARYEGEVAAADASVAGLIAAFRKARPNATVIVSADHGEEFGEHGGHHHGTTLYDEQVRVPLLWSSPGATRAGTVAAPVEIIDITTTLLAALGIPRDARMRGDDLGPLLRGSASGASRLRAFGSLEGARMWSDGTLKLICEEDGCRLFDLAHDPGERRDVSEARPSDVTRLRGELRAFVASLPKVEALAMSGGSAWPAALVRARLGDRSAGPELLPLLASPRSDVRAAAALALADQKLAAARTVLARMRTDDPDAAARAEAAIAALRLGEDAAHDQVQRLLVDGAASEAQKGRAALALAARGDASGEAVLCARAADPARDESARLEAISALAGLGDRGASPALVPLLAEVRLRPAVAEALGKVGDRAAVRALGQALSLERYPIARSAEARALFALGEKNEALRAVRRFLGTESGLPDGVELLLEQDALRAPSGLGADLRSAWAVRRGPWQCEPRGCRPLGGAAIVLPAAGAPRGRARAVLRALVEGGARSLRVSGVEHALNPPATEVAVGLERARGLALEVEASEGVLLQAIAVVAAADDVPPPPPEPWEADDAGDAASRGDQPPHASAPDPNAKPPSE